MPSLRREARVILTIQKATTPAQWMLVVGIATFLPLVIGELRGERAFCIFGSLAGYSLALATDRGTLWHRFGVISLALFLYAAAFLFGIFLRPYPASLLILSIAMPYAIGVVAGKAREAERILIFGGIQYYVAWYATSLTESSIAPILQYFAIAYAATLGTTALVRAFGKLPDQTAPDVATAVKYFKPRELLRHAYAFTYMSAVLASVLFVDHLNIERGYWTVITTLLLMKPTRRESFHRVMQRIFGSILGVGIGGMVLYAHPTGLTTVLLASGFAALVPFVWNRNYWLVSACATLFVFCLLDVAGGGELRNEIIWVRVKATLLGAGISLAAIAFYHFFEEWKAKARAAEAGE